MQRIQSLSAHFDLFWRINICSWENVANVDENSMKKPAQILTGFALCEVTWKSQISRKIMTLACSMTEWSSSNDVYPKARLYIIQEKNQRNSNTKKNFVVSNCRKCIHMSFPVLNRQFMHYQRWCIDLTVFFFSPFLDMCLEKRVFYRLISGLHSSINIHLCAKYLLSGKEAFISYSILPFVLTSIPTNKLLVGEGKQNCEKVVIIIPQVINFFKLKNPRKCILKIMIFLYLCIHLLRK